MTPYILVFLAILRSFFFSLFFFFLRRFNTYFRIVSWATLHTLLETFDPSLEMKLKPGMVAQAFNSNTQEAEVVDL